MFLGVLSINMNPVSQLEQKIGLKFKNPQILFQSLIHRSYINENKSQKLQSNERLEFLGDAVLELWSSQKIFNLFPQYPEGDLTNLRSLIVRTENLASVAEKLGIGDFIQLSKGEKTHGGCHNISLLADTFESIIGAIFLDQGMDQASQFLDNFLLPSIDTISQQKIYKDPKSIFQEIAQAKEGITPNYSIINESGPDHQKTFEIGVYISDRLIATGQGNSKQKAEEAAALAATKIYKV